MNDFMPCTNMPAQSSIEQGDIKPKDLLKGKLHISDFASWTCAFAGYEEVLLTAHPDKWKDLLQYRLHMLDFDIRYTWSAVYMYDIKFRAKLATKHSLSFGSVDSEVVSVVLTPDTLKESPRLCHRCKGPFHFASECFFRQEYSVAKGASEGQSQSSAQGMSSNRFQYQRGRGRAQSSFNNNSNYSSGSFNQQSYNSYNPNICQNWNRGQCNLGDRCFRTHRCITCGGRAPRHQCNNCNASPNWYSNNSNSSNQQSNSAHAPGNALHNVPTQSPGMGRSYGPPSQ